MGLLDGKVALITGGASGIGRACAIRFASEGADIVVADLQPGDATVAAVEAIGRRAIYAKTDTTSEADTEAMVAAGVAAFGHVDIGVASAGVTTAGGSVEDRRARVGSDTHHTHNLKLEEFTRVMDINLTGVMLTGRALVQQMLKQGTGGAIVNLASTAGRIPLAGAAPYSVSKAAVIMLTKVMALELANKGIRVNAVGPGYTSTPMWDVPEDSDVHANAMSITPMGRNGTPEEQAAACLYLASEESAFMTGQTLHPAGGQFTG